MKLYELIMWVATQIKTKNDKLFEDMETWLKGGIGGDIVASIESYLDDILEPYKPLSKIVNDPNVIPPPNSQRGQQIAQAIKGLYGNIYVGIECVSYLRSTLDILGAPISGLVEEMAAQSKQDFNTFKLSITDVLNAKWRSVQTGIDLDDQLQKQGMSLDQIALLDTVHRPIRSLPEIVTAYAKGLNDGSTQAAWDLRAYEDAFIAANKDKIAALGYDEDHAREVWRGHWITPQLGELKEWLYRGLITEDDIAATLPQIGISPSARIRIMQSLYAPLHKLDLRKLHTLGLISDDEAHLGYMRIGYSSQDAALMVSEGMTAKTTKQLGITDSLVQKFYKDGEYSRPQALDHLTKLGYPAEDAATVLDVIDIEEQHRLNEELIKVLHDEAVKGLITQAEYTDQINSLGVSPQRLNILLGHLAVDVRKNRPVPSKADLDKFYKAGLISESDYRQYLYDLGYTSEFIDLFVQLAAANAPTGG